MGDYIGPDVISTVRFKIDPIVIPSTAITKLEIYPHSSGGIGDIWKCARSTEGGNLVKVAVKSIRTSQINEQDLLKTGNRIRREAYVWITLKHDHILAFEGITDGFGKLPALVSLWMENGALSNYLKEEFSKLTDGRKLDLIHQVVDGLGYLHGKDVVHGDLTGTNILVDGSGNVRLADFGLSLIAAEAGNFTFGSVQSGNTRWMSPEFLNFSDDPESPLKPTKQGDIYSFGCVMLQILSGIEPYPRIKVAIQVIPAILGGRGPFHGVPIDMDDDCKRLSSRCLSKQPEGRPTIVDIAAILERLKQKNRVVG